MKGRIVKLRDLLLKAASHGVPQVLGVLLFMGGAGLGGTLVFSPSAFSDEVYGNSFAVVSPVAWGTAFIAASLALVVSILVDTAYAQLPALMLGALFIVFGLLTVVMGVSPVVWAFAALGWISVFTQILCWAGERHEAIYRYQSN